LTVARTPRLGRHWKTRGLMVLALVTPMILAIYSAFIGSWIYAGAFTLVTIVNLDLFYHSDKKTIPYTFRPFVKLESRIYKEPYDIRLEED